MMAERFAAWLLALDPDRRKSTSSPASWAGIFASGLVVMAIAGLVPVTRDYFGLRFFPALALFLPPIVVGLIGGRFEHQGRLSLRAYGAILFANSALFQLYMSSLVAFSRSPGAALMGAFPVLLACYHGHLLHSSPAHPFGTIATVLAVAGALVLNHDTEHLVLFSIIAPGAIGGSLVLGQFATGSLRERRERDALRQAVNAQMLSDRTRDVERAAGSVLRLRAHNHDAGNTLSSTLINAQLLTSTLEGGGTGIAAAKEALALAQDLLEGLHMLKSLLETAREVGIEEQLSFDTVELERVVRRVTASVAARHGAVALGVRIDPEFDGARVSVSGGETSLDRMLQNLVLNAVQGNGDRGASRVDVHVRRGSLRGQVAVVVEDDGPGFSQAQLDAQLSGFTTTKRHGTGLGLYTTDRLARASRGSVARANGPNGGARVALNLYLSAFSRETDAPSSPPPVRPRGEATAVDGTGAELAEP